MVEWSIMEPSILIIKLFGEFIHFIVKLNKLYNYKTLENG